MKILTDTITISPDVHTLSDYAGFQFFGLTALPLVQLDLHDRAVRPLGASQWVNNSTFTEWTFRLDERRRWSNGDAVTANQYRAAFQKILNDPKHRFRRLLSDLQGFAPGQSELSGMRISSHEIHFKLGQSNWFWPHLLSVACLSPVPDHPNQRSAGAYAADGLRRLQLNPYFTAAAGSAGSPVAQLEYVLPDELGGNDPYGFRAFECGEVALTCNTLFPAERVSEFQGRADFYREEAGLYSLLSLGDLSEEIPGALRRQLVAMTDTTALGDDLNGVFAPISGYEGVGARENVCGEWGARQNLSVAYEEFYPNRQILEGLQAQWRRYGVELELVAEAYGSRLACTHLRFEIRQSPIGDPYLLYRGEARQARFKNFSSRWAEYCALLWQYQGTSEEPERRQLGRRMESILADEGIVIPLLNIPSLYLKKAGLQHHHFQSGRVWEQSL